MKKIVLQVNSNYCSGCGICIEFCPREVLEFSPDLNRKGVHVAHVAQPELCTACGLCELYCPDFATAVAEKEMA